MRGIILGAGEVGQAYYDLLKPSYPETYRLDVVADRSDCLPEGDDRWDFLHVALRYNERWEDAVTEAVNRYHPVMVHVLSTVPPGTCERLNATHSTTRGLHPRLLDFIRATPKHVGGLHASIVADLFRSVGITCVEHKYARTTELLHALSNAAYGAEILFATEAERVCRHYGVDYYDLMRYAETHNEGYERMGYKSKYRPVLWPAGERIGGHCVGQSAQLIPPELRGPLLAEVAKHGPAADGQGKVVDAPLTRNTA